MRNKKQFRGYLRQFLLGALPKPMAHHMVRKAIDLSPVYSNTQLTYKLATTTDELKQAFQLTQKSYVREGYAQGSGEEIRITAYNLLPETSVIVALKEQTVVATISVIPRTRFGLPLEKVCSLQKILRPGKKIVEISALAVDRSVRGHQGEVLYNLMKFMYHFNVDVLDANHEVIGVNPKMVPLYEAILLFQRIPESSVQNYEFVNGAPVVPMHFSLDTADDSYGRTYQGFPEKTNLMQFFLKTPGPHFQIPSKSEFPEILPQSCPEKLREMIHWNSSLMTELVDSERNSLVSLYRKLPGSQGLLQQVLS